MYLAGLGLGATDFLHKQSLRAFHDAVAWFMQITMFLAFGLLVFPSHLVRVALSALAVAAVLMLVARPLAVFATLLRGWSARERALVSWVGLRGAVPIALATFPLVEEVAHADTIFNVVFFIVLLSVVAQGMSIPPVTRRLGLDAPAGGPPADRTWQEELVEDLTEVEVGVSSRAAGRRIVDLGLPEGALVVLVTRAGGHVAPQGGTLLRAGDRLLVPGDESTVAVVRNACAGD